MTVVVGSPEVAQLLQTEHIPMDEHVVDELQEAGLRQPLRAVVCCLPTPTPEGDFEEITVCELRRRVQTQLDPALQVARAAAMEMMVAAEGGAIVFVGGRATGAVQSSVLSALVSLSRSIVKEYRRYRIRSNVVVVPEHPFQAFTSLRFLLSPDSVAVAGERIDIADEMSHA
jgi:hypothetical protein